jgi:ABC-2 type transport system ATP-binding protein
MHEQGIEFEGQFPPLAVHGLWRRYGDQVAVRDLSLTIAPGEILGLVGPNGAGKTTTLRSVAGVLPLQEGRVMVAGHDLRVEEAHAKAALAWVPDEPRPFDTLTVWEHLEFTASLYGTDAWQPKAEVLLEQFSLTDKRGALGGELSRGMRQKLAFSCAWLSEPTLLLLDEPLSGLDPRGIRLARKAIRDLANQGVGVILSSHLLDLIEALADRLLILHEGRALFTGTLAEARTALAPQPGSSLEEIFLHATEGGSG